MESRKYSQRSEKDHRITQRLNTLAENIRNLPLDQLEQVEKFLKSRGKRVISLKKAAEMLDVSIDTIRRSVKRGSLKAFQLNRAGNWKIEIEELERFIKGKK